MNITNGTRPCTGGYAERLCTEAMFIPAPYSAAPADAVIARMPSVFADQQLDV
jgi:hypothetical protein